MIRSILASRPLLERPRSLGARHLLVLALVAVGGGCAVEDPVARLRSIDGGTGSFSSDDEALLEEEGLWLGPEDCVPTGTEPGPGGACEDAGTPDAP